MMNKPKLICPLITPLDNTCEPSREFYKLLISDLTEMGLTSIFPLGSTGLFSLLTMEKKRKFLKIVAEESQSMEIFVGIGSQNTDESIEFAKYASDLGFVNMVLQPTYYIRPEQPWIIRHFSEVMGNVEANFIVYNIPQLTGVTIEPETIKTIIENSSGRIKGIKESSGDLRYFNNIMLEFGSTIPVYQGQDDLLLQSLIVGSDGGVCGSTNISKGYVNVTQNTFINMNIRTQNSGTGTIIAASIVVSLIAILFVSYYYTRFSAKNKNSSK